MNPNTIAPPELTDADFEDFQSRLRFRPKPLFTFRGTDSNGNVFLQNEQSGEFIYESAITGELLPLPTTTQLINELATVTSAYNAMLNEQDNHLLAQPYSRAQLPPPPSAPDPTTTTTALIPVESFTADLYALASNTANTDTASELYLAIPSLNQQQAFLILKLARAANDTLDLRNRHIAALESSAASHYQILGYNASLIAETSARLTAANGSRRRYKLLFATLLALILLSPLFVGHLISHSTRSLPQTIPPIQQAQPTNP